MLGVYEVWRGLVFSAWVEMGTGVGGVEADVFGASDLAENVVVGVVVEGGDGPGGAEPDVGLDGGLVVVAVLFCGIRWVLRQGGGMTCLLMALGLLAESDGGAGLGRGCIEVAVVGSADVGVKDRDLFEEVVLSEVACLGDLGICGLGLEDVVIQELLKRHDLLTPIIVHIAPPKLNWD